jgi:hypothetical protein
MALQAVKTVGIVKRTDTNQVLFKQTFDFVQIQNGLDVNTAVSNMGSKYDSALSSNGSTRPSIVGFVEKYNAADELMEEPYVAYQNF